MTSCKDCIHYDVCSYHITEETNFTVNECPCEFKHKDQYVLLPVYIGQTVVLVKYRYGYIDNKFIKTGTEITEGKVSMIQQKADKSWKFRVSYRGHVCDYTANDIGREVFYTEEAAAIECRMREKELNI